MCLSKALCGTWTDGVVTRRDRMSEISRGHSRWMQTGEGLKALQFERIANLGSNFVRRAKAGATDKPNRSPIEGPNGSR